MYFVGLIILIVIWAMIEQNLLMTSRHMITVPKSAAGFAGTSFIVLADLHGYSFGKGNKRLIKKIDRLAPDFIVAVGDMVNKGENCISSKGFSLLGKLSEKYKIYYSLGNHEQYIREHNPSGWNEYQTGLQRLGIILLDNSSAKLHQKGSAIKLTGLTVGQEYYLKGKEQPAMTKGYLNGLLDTKSKTEFQILLAHNPLHFENYAAWGADLTIAGHIHGGLVRLPFIGGLLSPQVRFFPKYDAGKYEKNGRHMIVSRGLGSHSIMFRLFNPPEIVFVQFKR